MYVHNTTMFATIALSCSDTQTDLKGPIVLANHHSINLHPYELQYVHNKK